MAVHSNSIPMIARSHAVSRNFILNPSYWFAAMHFFLITRAHELVPLFATLGIVKLTFVAAIASTLYQITIEKRKVEFSVFALAFTLLLILISVQQYRDMSVTLKPYLNFSMTVFAMIALTSLRQYTRDRDILTYTIIGSSLFAAVQFASQFLSQVDGQRPILDTSNGDPNLGAWMIGMAIPLAVAKMIEHAQQRRVVYTVSCAGMTLLLCVGLIMTFSRSATIAITCALLVGLATPFSRRFIPFIMAAGVALLIWNPIDSPRFNAINPFQTDTIEKDDAAMSFRSKSMISGLHLTLGSPLFGVGFLQSRHLMNEDSGLIQTHHRATFKIHSGPLFVLAELGLVGFFVYMLPWIWAAIVLLKKMLKKQCGFEAPCFAAFLVFTAIMGLTLPLPYSYMSLFPIAFTIVQLKTLP